MWGLSLVPYLSKAPSQQGEDIFYLVFPTIPNSVHSVLCIYGFHIHTFSQLQIENTKKKFYRKFPKAKREFAPHPATIYTAFTCIYNYLHSIYIVLGIISNLEMV